MAKHKKTRAKRQAEKRERQRQRDAALVRKVSGRAEEYGLQLIRSDPRRAAQMVLNRRDKDWTGRWAYRDNLDWSIARLTALFEQEHDKGGALYAVMLDMLGQMQAWRKILALETQSEVSYSLCSYQPHDAHTRAERLGSYAAWARL